VGKRFRFIVLSVILALLIVSIVPTVVMAAMQPMSASGSIDSISGTVGFPLGNSGNYMVSSRTVSGNFTSGDLSGGYAFTYKGNIDLNTQAGHINGTLLNGPYNFTIDGNSYPVTWAPSSDSPVGYVGSSTASGIWKWKDGGGSGNFSCNFSFVPTADGHIDYILPGSAFELSGQWNPK
jgi:hypothetical protein